MMIGLSTVQRRMRKKKELKNVSMRRLTVYAYSQIWQRDKDFAFNES